MVAHAFNLGIWETGRQLSLNRVPDQPRIIVRPNLKNKTNNPPNFVLSNQK